MVARPGQASSKDFPFRGVGICRFCGGEVKPPKISWCSTACVMEYRRLTDWGAIRRRILLRDDYRCVLCGNRDPNKGPLLQVDHIVELADGGAWGDEANLRTLCLPCHKAKTKEARRARAARLKAESEEALRAALQG
jgi:5-methylcytosine-specific restriction endonuclease McrA